MSQTPHETLMDMLPEVVDRILGGDREPALRFAELLKATPDDGRHLLISAAFATMLLDSGRCVPSSLTPALKRAWALQPEVFAPLLRRAGA